VSGSLSATSAVSLTAGAISIPGLVSDGGGGTTMLTATTGGITEAGVLVAGTLSGSAVGTVSLVGATSGSNRVATVAGFTAPAFALTDGTDLLVTDVLNATNIALSAPTSQITLGNGASIVTGGGAPTTSGPLIQADEPQFGAPGAFIQAATFTQIGTSTLAGRNGGPATLQISVSQSAQFDPPLGLQAGNGWLILGLANGTAGGNVYVGALNVTYNAPGSANLFGTIDGIAGRSAAAAGFIQPSVNTNYRFNGCEIGAAACLGGTLLDQLDSTAAFGSLYPLLPQALPGFLGLPTIVLLPLPPLATPACEVAAAGAPQPPCALTDPDVVPPNVSYVDY